MKEGRTNAGVRYDPPVLAKREGAAAQDRPRGVTGSGIAAPFKITKPVPKSPTAY